MLFVSGKLSRFSWPNILPLAISEDTAKVFSAFCRKMKNPNEYLKYFGAQDVIFNLFKEFTKYAHFTAPKSGAAPIGVPSLRVFHRDDTHEGAKSHRANNSLKELTL